MKRTVLGLAGITAVFMLWMLLVWLAPAWDAVAPSTEAHVCHLAVAYSRDPGPVTRERLAKAAVHADPDLFRAIRHYVLTGKGWDNVLHLCGYGL